MRMVLMLIFFPGLHYQEDADGAGDGDDKLRLLIGDDVRRFAQGKRKTAQKPNNSDRNAI